VGLAATVVGSVAAVIAIPFAAWQVGLAISDRRRQRRECSCQANVSDSPTPAPRAGNVIDQRGQQVHGPQLNVAGYVDQLVNVGEIKLAYERAPLPTADPEQLARAQALLASLPTDSLPVRGTLPAGSRMPLAPNPLFVGRSDELLRIASALKGGETVALGHIVAATGLGGLGKTQLAVELVHRFSRFFAGGVFWLSFASSEEIPLKIAACAGPGAMGLATGIEGLSLEERLELVLGAWRSGLPRLLVFDNCEEEALLDAWRPPSGGCRVLVTSRRARWSPTLGVNTLQLDVLPRPDSIELLRRYQPDLVPDEPGLDAIAHELGDLPLALHLAGSYLRAYRAAVSLSDYLAELAQPALLQHASLLGRGLEDSPSPTRHVQSLAQTFVLSLAGLDKTSEVDRVAMAMLARLAPGEPVPRDLLARTLGEVEPLDRADGLRRLEALGLVEGGDGWLRLHRLLVHFVHNEGVDPAASAAVYRELITCGQNATDGHLTGLPLAAVIPHVLYAAATASVEDVRAAELPMRLVGCSEASAISAPRGLGTSVPSPFRKRC
jgi:hypothetical protein